MKSEFPEGSVAFALSADIDPALFGGGLCVAQEVEYDLKELVDNGDGYIVTDRSGLIDLLIDLSAFERLDDIPADAPQSALVAQADLPDPRLPVEQDPTPLTHPGEFTVDVVLAAFEEATPRQIARTIDLEEEGRKRKTILDYGLPPESTDGEQTPADDPGADGAATKDDGAGDGTAE